MSIDRETLAVDTTAIADIITAAKQSSTTAQDSDIVARLAEVESDDEWVRHQVDQARAAVTDEDCFAIVETLSFLAG
jgi:LPS sulfotransferase NodH